MTFKLVAEWKDVVRHAWSVRFIALAAVLTGLEVTLPLFSEFFAFGGPITVALSVGSGLAAAAAFVARIVAQKNLPENA